MSLGSGKCRVRSNRRSRKVALEGTRAVSRGGQDSPEPHVCQAEPGLARTGVREVPSGCSALEGSCYRRSSGFQRISIS